MTRSRVLRSVARFTRCRRALACALLTLGSGGELAAQEPQPGGVIAEDLMDDPAIAAEAEAAQAYAEGDLARAIAIYREIGASHRDPRERTRLGVTAAWLLFEQGNREAAAQELAQALFHDPGFAPRTDLYSTEFVALFQDAQAEAARERVRTAQRRLQEGVAAAAAGERQRARTLLEESLALVPQQPRAIHALAALSLSEGDADAALAGFEKVLALERSSPDQVPAELKGQALNNVGVIYIGRKQFEDATEALEQAVALRPDDARAWFNLALARLALGRKIDGSVALERAYRLDAGDPEIALRLAQTYREAQSWVESVAMLLEATRRHPADPALSLELGRAQLGLGNAEGAFASFARAMELDADGALGAAHPAAIAAAEAALARQEPARASENARRATELAPDDASGWSLLGLALQGEGRLDEAAASLTRASELAPARAEPAYNLGTVFLAQKRPVEAESAFRRALEIDPAFAEAQAALARLESARQATSSAPATRNAKRKPAPPPRQLGALVSAVDYTPLGIRGLLVEQVTPGGLAAKAGLLLDDLILRADGRPLTSVQALEAMVRGSKARSIALSLLRSGKPVELQLGLN